MKLFAKKSLGQHFLNSPSVLAKIVDAAAIKPGEIILEIGPGTGILTKELLKISTKVIAVEKDDRAIDILKEKFAGEVVSGALTIVNADILETDRYKIKLSGDEVGLKDSGYALVANIPYYITGAILESFLEHTPRPNRMVLLVQKEVAERIVARDHKESVLSVSVKAFGTPRLVATVPPGAFTPPPTVDSAILSVSNISTSKMTEMTLETRLFFDIVKAGFAHKRKFLKSNLTSRFEQVVLNKIWKNLGIDDKIRAEDLPVEKWFDLSKEYLNS